MIYLARSVSVDFETGEIFDLLKIGLTLDEAKLDSYFKSSNPCSKFLYKIEGCDQKLRSKILALFKKYRNPAIEESTWFNYNEEIVKFFEENKTEEDLKKSLP
jgi:hypothetical protein